MDRVAVMAVTTAVLLATASCPRLVKRPTIASSKPHDANACHCTAGRYPEGTAPGV